MPLALIAIAWLLVMTGINGNYSTVGAAFNQDVLGGGKGGGYLNFLVGIIGIAAFFRVIGMPNAGRLFLILVIVVFLLQNANVLTTLESLGSSPSSTASTTATGAATASSTAAPATTTTSTAAPS